MNGDIRHAALGDADYLLGQAKHGVRYRLTVEEPDGTRRTGIVRAEVSAPRIEVIPGRVTFVLDGASLDENGLYGGPIHTIIALEELT